MMIQNLYHELQLNPRNKVAYREISEYYRSLGMTNEAEAFLELIRKKFDADHTDSDPKQREHD